MSFIKKKQKTIQVFHNFLFHDSCCLLRSCLYMCVCVCACGCEWNLSTLLSARLVMQALTPRWATKAASRAAAALWDWMHMLRTCCHQGETDWGSHDSSTAPRGQEEEEEVTPLLSFPLLMTGWQTLGQEFSTQWTHTGTFHVAEGDE